MPTMKDARPKSWLPTMSVNRCGPWHASLACPATRFSPGLKKAAQLPPLKKTLAKAKERDVLKLDEVWLFVQQRTNKGWVWSG